MLKEMRLSDLIMNFFCRCFTKLAYFFGYKMSLVFFTFQNDPKNLDPSYKMDIDLQDYLGRVKLVL